MRIVSSFFVVALLLGWGSIAVADPPGGWTKYCTKCHGDDGKGKTKMGERLKVSDVTTAEWQDKRKDADIKKSVREGNAEKKQPAFGTDKLSDSELDEVVKFMRSLRKP